MLQRGWSGLFLPGASLFSFSSTWCSPKSFRLSPSGRSEKEEKNRWPRFKNESKPICQESAWNESEARRGGRSAGLPHHARGNTCPSKFTQVKHVKRSGHDQKIHTHWRSSNFLTPRSLCS